jgi:glycine C-acetyltransferase
MSRTIEILSGEFRRNSNLPTCSAGSGYVRRTMPIDRLDQNLAEQLEELEAAGTDKGSEWVVTDVLGPRGGLGPRYRLAGHDIEFLRMNSNSYLGLSPHPAVVGAEESATQKFGAGPGAVRFISGTYKAHVDLEARLASFHEREASVVYSSAYAAVVSTLVSLITEETVVLSDELNHNCIINGIRMARPSSRAVYAHLDMSELDEALASASGKARRAIVVTDGVFSMRGDNADLAAIGEVVSRHDADFPENVVVIVDDSHGVGAYGSTGRGTEEVTRGHADVLIGTLGKAFGVNGGYVTGTGSLVTYLREKSPMYIYSNPITVGEAAAAEMAVTILDSPEGLELLTHLGAMTERFETGLMDAGFETIPGPHPVVPLMVRDTERTAALVGHLFANGILATGLNYPVVPKGDEEIRFQVSADHTSADIDHALTVLTAF